MTAASPQPLVLLRGSVVGGAATQLSLSETLLERVAGGWAPVAARLYVPAPTVAFGRLDTFEPGFEAAVQAARDHGFEPVVRAPGGRVAAYHEGSVVFELVEASPGRDARLGINDRYASMSGLVITALRALGVPAELGELPGEYCPGRYSILAGGVKLGGIAQRVIAGASLTGIAIVVEDGTRVRAVLEDVSGALGYAFDPATAGAVDDVRTGITPADVSAALERVLASEATLVRAAADPDLLATAAARAQEHEPRARAGRSRPPA